MHLVSFLMPFTYLTPVLTILVLLGYALPANSINYTIYVSYCPKVNTIHLDNPVDSNVTRLSATNYPQGRTLAWQGWAQANWTPYAFRAASLKSKNKGDYQIGCHYVSKDGQSVELKPVSRYESENQSTGPANNSRWISGWKTLTCYNSNPQFCPFKMRQWLVTGNSWHITR